MNKFFTVIYEGTDLSKKVKDFGTAPVSVELAPAEYLYVGFYKMFNQFFVELGTKNTVANNMTAEYFDGTTWQPLNTLLDESEGFIKSGFFFFEKPNNWAKTTIGGQENLYVRLLTDTTHSVGTKIQGLAILLSNDLDLEGVRANVVTKFNDGNSWVLKHEQVRKDIIQLLRNKGNRVVKNSNPNNPLVTEGAKFADLTEFDLLETDQLRQASLYKVLSGIYLDELSDNIDDKWDRQGKRYEGIFFKMFNLFSLQIDNDDNGAASDDETNVSTNTSLVWV